MIRSAVETEAVASRVVPRTYRVARRRADVVEYVLSSLVRGGATLLFASGGSTMPLYVSVMTASGERRGLMIYPFTMTLRATKNRSAGELRGQIRYGSGAAWHTDDHFVYSDVSSLDTTLLIGVSPEEDVVVGLDPRLYSPLPMGISFYAQQPAVEEVREAGWSVWERANLPGSRRSAPRTQEGLETIAGFTGDRLMTWAEFSREADSLELDQALRYGLAQRFLSDASVCGAMDTRHVLERQFDLSAAEILQLITERFRLEVAVRGGVAEQHLERQLVHDDAVLSVDRLDQDGEPDFDVELAQNFRVRVECKNCSPEKYADGTAKVEVQKTRGSSEPGSRFYLVDHFDVVAACMYPVTGEWKFRFARSRVLERHKAFPERLAAVHRIDARWSDSLEGALAAEITPTVGG